MAIAVAIPTATFIVSGSAIVISWMHQKGVSSDNRDNNATASHQSDIANTTLRQMGNISLMPQCLEHTGVVTALKGIADTLAEIKKGQERLWDVVNKFLVDNGDKHY